MKKLHKKLVLNKKTVSNLDFGQMTAVKGGILTEPLSVCQECTLYMCTGWTCGACAYTIADCETELCG